MTGESPIEEVWGPRYLVVLERQLWVAVMEFQNSVSKHLVSDEELEASRKVVRLVDLDSIQERELVTKHDLKARLDEFVHLSGHSRIHLGLTSADVVENTYSIRQRRSVQLLGERVVNACRLWLLDSPFRGVRGPVGSDVDQLELLGEASLVQDLQRYVAEKYGFGRTSNAVSQCLPRSNDLHLATCLLGVLDDPGELAVANGLVSMLSHQQFWLEGDVSSSVVRRYAWPLLFRVVEGTYGGVLSDRK